MYVSRVLATQSHMKKAWEECLIGRGGRRRARVGVIAFACPLRVLVVETMRCPMRVVWSPPIRRSGSSGGGKGSSSSIN